MSAMTKKQLMLKLLANRFEKDQGIALFQLLSEPEKANLETIDTSCNQPEVLLPRITHILNEHHYSWLIQPLESFSSPLKELIVRALPSRIRPSVTQHLKISVSDQPIPLSLRRHLLHLLWKKMHLDDSFNLQLIESTPFDFLLEKSKKELVLLTELLGVQEIAECLRTTIDKKIMQKVLHSLDEMPKRYLYHCLSQKKKAHLSQKIALEMWDGSSESLHKLIMLRGIRKLGIALSGQPASFLWHLTRKFDIGRGNLLKKNLHEVAIPTATELFADEVRSINQLIAPSSK